MYIQPPQEGQPSLQIPQDYSGNAFFAKEAAPVAESFLEEAEKGREVPQKSQEEVQHDTESVQTGAFLHREQDHQASHEVGWQGREAPPHCAPKEHVRGGGEGKCDRERGGIFSRFPFLSSLLPPARGRGECEKKQGHSELVQWAIIGLAVLLFLEDSSDDILPLLLLLLLWD